MPLTQVFDWADGPGVARILALDDDGAIARLAELIRGNVPAPDATIALINEIMKDVETREDLDTVGAVAGAFGKSERWLQQVFRDYLGIGLKWLLQRKRLVAAAGQIRDADEPDWVGIAYELGYSSQQHFITDFKTVLGSTPVQYKKGLRR